MNEITRYKIIKGDDIPDTTETKGFLTLTGAKGTFAWDVGNEITIFQVEGEAALAALVEAGNIQEITA